MPSAAARTGAASASGNISARISGLQSGEQGTGIHHFRELAVQRGELQGMHALGIVTTTIVAGASISGAGIRHQEGAETQVAGHAGGGGDAVGSGETRDDYSTDPLP